MIDKDGKVHRVYDPKDVIVTVDGVEVTPMTAPEPGVFHVVDKDGSEWLEDSQGNRLENNNEQH